MKRYLKDDLKLKIPIIGMGGFIEKDDLTSMINIEVLDTHYYIDHPIFPIGKSWDRDSFYIEPKKDIKKHYQDFNNRFLILNKHYKPVTITEWNHCYPSPYAYETPLLFGYVASQKGIDAIFQFSFIDNLNFLNSKSGIQNYFNIYNNPQQLILHLLAAKIFLSHENFKLTLDETSYTLKGKHLIAMIGNIKDKSLEFNNLKFEIQANGVFIVMKLNEKEYAVFAFSEIKNFNSYFNIDGTFNWGTSPITLKSVPYALKYSNEKIISARNMINDSEKINFQSNTYNKITKYPFLLIKKE